MSILLYLICNAYRAITWCENHQTLSGLFFLNRISFDIRSRFAGIRIQRCRHGACSIFAASARASLNAVGHTFTGDARLRRRAGLLSLFNHFVECAFELLVGITANGGCRCRNYLQRATSTLSPARRLGQDGSSRRCGRCRCRSRRS